MPHKDSDRNPLRRSRRTAAANQTLWIIAILSRLGGCVASDRTKHEIVREPGRASGQRKPVIRLNVDLDSRQKE